MRNPAPRIARAELKNIFFPCHFHAIYGRKRLSPGQPRDGLGAGRERQNGEMLETAASAGDGR